MLTRLRVPLIMLLWLPLGLAQQRDIFSISRDAAKAYNEKNYADYRRFMEEARSLAPQSPGVVWGVARAQARTGDRDQAMQGLERLVAMEAWYDVKASPDLEVIRDEPRVKAVADAMAKLKERRGNSEVAFRGPAGVNPESIAYDPRDKGFFLGSSQRKIVKWLPNGIARDFASGPEAGLWMVLGIKLDAKRRVLWANSCNLGAGGAMSPLDPESVGSGAIFRFHADTGKLLSKDIIGTKEKPACVNDLTIGPGGEAYVTFGPELRGGSILRVDTSGGKVETFYQPDANFLGNGIAIDEAGKKLYVADSLRGVLAIDIQSRQGKLLPAPEHVAMNTIDGLYVHRGTLVAIQNHPAITRVARFRLDSGRTAVTAVETLERNHPDFTLPTTGVIVGDTLYFVANTAVRDAKENDAIVPVILKVALRKKD